jgi:hypothetical protein
MTEKHLLQSINSYVSKRIGRSLTRLENRAIGFLMGQNNYGEKPEQTSENFLSSVCGVKENDSTRDVSIKILEAVCVALHTEYTKRLNDTNQEKEKKFLEALEVAALNPLQERLERVQQQGSTEEVHFSGVPGYWIPEWVPVM